MKWLNRLNYKYGRYGIPNLMMYLSGAMLFVYAVDLLIPAIGLSSWLYLDMHLVAQGQVWRLISFIIYPPASNPLFVAFSLYFYVWVGRSLEQYWGTFRFNVFYLFGVIGTIIGALFTGFAVNNYLNLSLFFAFAMLYPNVELRLFFILPVKVKWLALIDLIYFVYGLLAYPVYMKVSIIVSMLNILLFFGPDWFTRIKQKLSYQKTRRNFKRNYRNNNR